MSKQPEALRLAECLEAYEAVEYDAAAELRRLHEENAAAHAVGIRQERALMRLEAANAELLEALQKLEEKPDYTTSWLVARAAIAKHGGQ